jgi:hypothetical protein
MLSGLIVRGAARCFDTHQSAAAIVSNPIEKGSAVGQPSYASLVLPIA